MEVEVLSFSPSTKTHVLASAKIQLTLVDGDSLIVDDVRVLQNKRGELWLSMPNRSIPVGKAAWEYLPVITLSARLKREVEDVVIAAYEKWAAGQAQPVSTGGAQ